MDFIKFLFSDGLLLVIVFIVCIGIAVYIYYNRHQYYKENKESIDNANNYYNQLSFEEKKNINDNITHYNTVKINENVPHCPTCSSANIERISATSKVAGAVTFGLFSKTARSQFKCDNCGYKW